jgi:hypothetical protein
VIELALPCVTITRNVLGTTQAVRTVTPPAAAARSPRIELVDEQGRRGHRCRVGGELVVAARHRVLALNVRLDRPRPGRRDVEHDLDAAGVVVVEIRRVVRPVLAADAIAVPEKLPRMKFHVSPPPSNIRFWPATTNPVAVEAASVGVATGAGCGATPADGKPEPTPSPN